MMHRKLMRVRSGHARAGIAAWAAWCIALTGGAYAQGQKPDSQKVEEALGRVQRWQHDQRDPIEQVHDVRLLAQAGATAGIPTLKQEFAVTTDTWLKLVIAGALVRLGDRDAVYWDFLADEAKKALENDAPPFFILDSEGNVVPGQGQFPAEFVAWAKAHNLEPAVAAQDQIYELPRHFVYLAETGDPRGRELLRMGLKSRNSMIQSFAVRGLAKLQDKESIPLIIEAAKTSPRYMTVQFGKSLLFFDDPQAQSAAETFISDKRRIEELRRLIREHGADPFLY